MTNNKHKEIMETELKEWEGKEIFTLGDKECLPMLKNSLKRVLTEQLEELERWVTDKQKIYVDELKKENGVVLIKKLYTDEEKRADSQGSYLSLDNTLSHIREQKEIINKK